MLQISEEVKRDQVLCHPDIRFVKYGKKDIGFIVDKDGSPWFLDKYIHRIVGKLGVALSKRCGSIENHGVSLIDGEFEGLLNYEGLIRALCSLSRKSFPYAEQRSRKLLKYMREHEDIFFFTDMKGGE